MTEQKTVTSGVSILKTYFDPPPVTNKELLEMRKLDSDGYDELVALAAIELGVEVKKKVGA